jgi:hypothetical protein
MKNGKIIESDRTQTYEDPREKKVQGVHNGKSFAYVQKKPQFSLFPKKHVSFLKLPIRRISYTRRTPTPYPLSKKHKHKKYLSFKKRNPKLNITKNKK